MTQRNTFLSSPFDTIVRPLANARRDSSTSTRSRNVI